MTIDSPRAHSFLVSRREDIGTGFNVDVASKTTFGPAVDASHDVKLEQSGISIGKSVT